MSEEHIQVPPPVHPAPMYAGNGAAAAEHPQPAAPPPRPSMPVESKDSLREIIETVVFVIVLVLLLKSFVAEAFVIPTGSMAETLWGYQKLVDCPQCHYSFPVNCSKEVEEPRKGRDSIVTHCVCPNCRYAIDFEKEHINPRPQTGDRVLVDKSLYDLVEKPQRFDVVVFKFPGNPGDQDGPQKDYVPMNYIKRLIGLPGETIAIYNGDLYQSTDLHYDEVTPDPHNGYLRRETFTNDRRASDLFQKQLESQFEKKFDDKGFDIVRKPPEKMLALRRIVYDNDYQADDLKSRPPRWSLEGKWKPDNPVEARRFEHPTGSEGLDWLTYQHILRESDKPQLITDYSGYNGGTNDGPLLSMPRENWVGDLLLECEVTIEKPQGQLRLDLAKGVDRFQARWDLATGVCTLIRESDGKETVLDSRATDLKKPGTFRLRFANVDERLTVWVDSKLPFDDGVTYKPPHTRGPYENDLKPARIGVEGGGVIVDHVKLWRDTYYTTSRSGNPSASDAEVGDWTNGDSKWENPDEWEPLRRLPWKTLYVQPGHYLCLGDNSPESSDGRYWGLVPRRLLLGRALLVYYPVDRAGRIR